MSLNEDFPYSAGAPFNPDNLPVISDEALKLLNRIAFQYGQWLMPRCVCSCDLLTSSAAQFRHAAAVVLLPSAAFCCRTLFRPVLCSDYRVVDYTAPSANIAGCLKNKTKTFYCVRAFWAARSVAMELTNAMPGACSLRLLQSCLHPVVLQSSVLLVSHKQIQQYIPKLPCALMHRCMTTCILTGVITLAP